MASVEIGTFKRICCDSHLGGKDRPSTDKGKNKHKQSPICSTMHKACMLNPCLGYPIGSPTMPSRRGRIDPPQIGKEKESPRKQLPICSTTKPVCSTHVFTILRLTRYAIWEGKDRPSTDNGKESPRKQLPICSTTKPVCSTHVLTIL